MKKYNIRLKRVNKLLIISLLISIVFTTSCVKKNDEKQIISFIFENPQAEGIINQSARTIIVTVPEGTDVTALVPIIQISKSATISPASGVAQNFTSPITYTVKAEDGTMSKYTVTVKSASQLFPDGGFENVGTTWIEKIRLGTTEKYWDFHQNYILSSLNLLHDLSGELGEAPLTAFRETVKKRSGNYAIKTVSNIMTVGGETIFLPGVAATITIDIAAAEDFIVTLGSDYSYRPSSLRGFMQYEPINNDSAAIEIRLTHYNEATNKHSVIGKGKKVFCEKIDSWTEFSVPINYTSEQTPNSIIIVFSASAAYDFTSFNTLMECKGQVGSTLYIDDVEFED